MKTHFLVNKVWLKENWPKSNIYKKLNFDSFLLKWKFYTISDYNVSLSFQEDIFGLVDYNRLSSKLARLKTNPFKLLPFIHILRWFQISWCDNKTLNIHQLPSYLSYLVHFWRLKAWIIKNYMSHSSRFSTYLSGKKMFNVFSSL